jgi:hypothetical protein
MADERLDQQANLITFNPKLRAEYFENPSKVLARAIPRKGLLERISPGAPERTRALRAELGEKVEHLVNAHARLVSAREAYFEKNLFLNEALRNPQRTFDAILWLSILAFAIGVSFLAGAFLAAILGDGTTEKAVLGGLSGGGGAATTLGTLFAMSRDAIRKANGDNAQIRLILTDFATEITHFRSITPTAFEPQHLPEAKALNNAIRDATNKAVRMLEKYGEPKEREEKKP